MTRARDIADAARFINTLDGVAATLEGVELNLLDGVTATTAELNILDGVTATAVELNYVDGVTSAVQTQLNTATTAINTKSPTASPTFTGAVNASETLQIGGVAITSTPAELNILDGVTATATELNYLDGVTSDLQTQITAAAASGGGGSGDVAAYKVTTTFTAPVFFKKIDIIPNNTTVAGTWELFGTDTELWVSALSNIETNDEYMVGTKSLSNHIFYGTGFVGDDSVITVTNTMQGFGDASTAAAAGESTSLGTIMFLGGM
jgi:hypothetical protein